ncbi:MAG: helix-turn-helix domain-containing protein [Smithellaceae bacterium]
MNVIEILNRVGEVIGSNENVAIAKALQVSPQSASNYKSRKAIPWGALYQFSRDRGISMEWLLTGKGDVRAPASTPPSAEESDKRIMAVQRLLDLLEAEPEYADAATAAIGLIRRIQALEHRVRDLEAHPTSTRTDEDLQAG